MGAVVIGVRNQDVLLHSRLWCVFELWAAEELGKEIVMVGLSPLPNGQNTEMAMADCSSEEDTKMLRQAILSRCAEVMTPTTGGISHVSRSNTTNRARRLLLEPEIGLPDGGFKVAQMLSVTSGGYLTEFAEVAACEDLPIQDTYARDDDGSPTFNGTGCISARPKCCCTVNGQIVDSMRTTLIDSNQVRTDPVVRL